MDNEANEKKTLADELLKLFRRGSLDQIQDKIAEVYERGWCYECRLLHCSRPTNNELFIYSRRDRDIPLSVTVGAYPF